MRVVGLIYSGDGSKGRRGGPGPPVWDWRPLAPLFWALLIQIKLTLSQYCDMNTHCAYKLLHELFLLQSIVLVAFCHSSPEDVFSEPIATV